MNLQDINKNIVKKAQQKLTRHKSLGANSNLSINKVAELLDIVHGMASPQTISPDHFIGNYSLN